MKQEILRKAYLLDSKINYLKQLHYVFNKPVRFKIEATSCTPNGNFEPYFTTPIIVENIFEPELAELIKNWAIQKRKETEQELELL